MNGHYSHKVIRKSNIRSCGQVFYHLLQASIQYIKIYKEVSVCLSMHSQSLTQTLSHILTDCASLTRVSLSGDGESAALGDEIARKELLQDTTLSHFKSCKHNLPQMQYTSTPAFIIKIRLDKTINIIVHFVLRLCVQQNLPWI